MQMRSWRVVGATVVPLVLATHTAVAAPIPPPAPADSGGQRVIVTMKDASAVGDAAALVDDTGGELHVTFDRVSDGFAATLPAATIEELAMSPDVASVVPDPRTRIGSTQVDPPWHLDRIDQPQLPRDERYGYDTTGAGVSIYIADTGIRYDHAEFGGRAIPGFDFVDPGQDGYDCNGHGTAMAGVAGGKTYGVAKQAQLVSLRVFDCFGWAYESDFIAALDWVVTRRKGPAVVNYSAGSTTVTEAARQAVERATAAGVVIVISAGNTDQDACENMAAGESPAINVGATTHEDQRAAWSNHGPCVDVFAPGDWVLSSSHETQTASRYTSGTSLAAAAVSGAAARLLQRDPAATARAITHTLIATAAPVVTDAKSSASGQLYLPAPPPDAPLPPAPTGPVAGWRPQDRFTHDWDGDNRADVLAVTGTGALMLYPGNGRGGWGRARQIGWGWSGMDIVLQVGDWDRISRPQLIARSHTGRLYHYTGDGRGGFAARRQIGQGWGGFRSLLAPGDWNADGQVDLIAVRADDNTMWLYPNDHLGGFGTPRQIGSGWTSDLRITAVADWDGLGSPDLVSRDAKSGRLLLHANNRSGGFWAPRVIGWGWGSFTTLVGTGNWDGDPHRDLLARTSAGKLVLYRGNGTGGFLYPYPTIGHGWNGLRIVSAETTAPPAAPTPPPPPPTEPAVKGSARDLLFQLPVAPESGEGYDRQALFGGWVDADGDGCDTRAEALEQESTLPVTYADEASCSISWGHWDGYYDGIQLSWPSEVDVEHLVPLREAWESGAKTQAWSAARRAAFANDLAYEWTLQVVADHFLATKASRDPSQWLPPAQAAHCRYATRWVAVKYRWGLSVDEAERRALAGILTGDCGSALLPRPPAPQTG